MSKVEIIKRGIVYKSDGLFGYAAWPSVERLADGRLAAVFSGGRVKHVCPFGKTMICYSSDEGETWTAPAAIVDTYFDDRDGGIKANGNQVLITSFNNNFAFQKFENEKTPDGAVKDIIDDYIACNENKPQDEIGSSVWVSDDGGNVFGKHYKMPITAPHGPIVLADGRYFYVGRSFGIEEKFLSPEDKRDFLPEGIYYSYSSDGYTWTEPKSICDNIPAGELWCEPHAIQLNNGEIAVFVRVQDRSSWTIPFRTIKLTSSNNVTTWSEPEDLGLIAAPPHLMRHSSGAIILTVGRREKPYAEQILISNDDGKTWSEPIDIDDAAVTNDMGYPASVELKDGSILTLYYQHDEENQNNYIKYTVWKLL